VDFRIELIPLAVQDVDRSVDFYGNRVGWNIDFDQTVGPELRFVQVTPPGSAASIAFGLGLTTADPGSVQGLQVVVDDADAAHDDLAARGITVAPVEDLPWGRFVHFTDPDGNAWSVQQVPAWADA